ncbi:MAG: hypothetical protein ISR58_05645 [Anaerolineales bacterium]|nr:hypothetical protein [Chloroflexota bacterium]MBL6980659.1 hypothetical protein [Anaerolineales bacterium]
MSVFESSILKSFLAQQVISRIRRNHGLEHATLHVLAEKNAARSMGGHSNPSGFWLVADIPTEEIQEAVREALRRLRAGERHLAVHPGCGTNFATAGTMAGLAGVVGMWGVGARKRDKLERLPLVATLATLALIFAQPFGNVLQKHITTSGDPGDMEIVEITFTQRGRVKAHRVITRG